METVRFDDETARQFAQKLVTVADVLRGAAAGARGCRGAGDAGFRGALRAGVLVRPPHAGIQPIAPGLGALHALGDGARGDRPGRRGARAVVDAGGMGGSSGGAGGAAASGSHGRRCFPSRLLGLFAVRGTRSRNPVSSGTPPERRSSPSPLPGPMPSWGRSSLSGPPDSVDAASDLHVEAIDAGQARNKLPFETESGDETAWVGRQYSRDH